MRTGKLVLTVMFLTPALFCSAQFNLPEGSLGGMIKSDRWVIRKNQQQEDFVGNVSYDSQFYTLRADAVYTDRKKNDFKAEGQVYLKEQKLHGPSAELYAERVAYNTNTGKGSAKSAKDAPVRFIYDIPGEYKAEAEGLSAAFNTKKEVLSLREKVKLAYETNKDFMLVFADKADTDKQKGSAVFTGNVDMFTSQYSAGAEKAEVSDNGNFIELKGAEDYPAQRPVLTASTQDGEMALEAEFIFLDNNAGKAGAGGGVQGWLQPREITTPQE